MQRIIFTTLAPTSRQFTTSAFVASKASKNRGNLPKARPAGSSAPSRPPGPAPAGSLGTRENLFEGAEANAQPKAPSSAHDAPATEPSEIEQEMLDAQHIEKDSGASGARDELRGTGVGASEAAYGPEETVVGREGVKGA